ncbi:MAG: hypothetical protein RR053_04690, partial [Evtepia sp.]
DCPYLLGNTVGYGIPGGSGSGLYRGAYNAANQILAQVTMEKVHYKFQYDFTPAQANDVAIGTIGLTHQYLNYGKETTDGFKNQGFMDGYQRYTNDGRYSYRVDSGIITKYDVLLAVKTQIDVSAIIGTSTANTAVAYSDTAKLWYIFVYSTTVADRKVYAFTDNTFSTLSATYAPTNLMYIYSNCSLFVYGDFCFMFAESEVNYFDFVHNTGHGVVDVSKLFGHVTENGYRTDARSADLNHGKYVFALGGYGNYDHYQGLIFDMSTKSRIGATYGVHSSSPYPMKHHMASHFLPCTVSSNTISNNCAISAKTLATPITKTSANGMTATYEFDVFW